MNATFYCNDSEMIDSLHEHLAPLGVHKIYTLYEPLLQDDEGSQYALFFVAKLTYDTNIFCLSLIGLVARKEKGLAYLQCRVRGRFPHYEVDSEQDRREWNKETRLRDMVTKASANLDHVLYTVVVERRPRRRRDWFKRSDDLRGHFKL
jgi:hypothetical protein